jgi:U3 small nucleolar RNA-associated protein 23
VQNFWQGKKVRKSMAMYTHVFGFRAPYRVLCDGNFLQASLDMKLYVKEMLPKTLLGPCVPLVSTCIRSELQHIGDRVSGASLIAKRFECIRCSCGDGGSRIPSARSDLWDL